MLEFVKGCVCESCCVNVSINNRSQHMSNSPAL